MSAAVHIAIGQRREPLGELPRDREKYDNCRSGQRAYIGTRMLMHNGFKAKTIQGGLLAFAYNHL